MWDKAVLLPRPEQIINDAGLLGIVGVQQDLMSLFIGLFGQTADEVNTRIGRVLLQYIKVDSGHDIRVSGNGASYHVLLSSMKLQPKYGKIATGGNIMKLFNFAARFSWVTVLILLIITGSLATYIPDLKIQVSAQGLVDKDDPSYQFHQRIVENYGAADSIAILIQDDDLFQPERLADIKQLYDALVALPFISGGDSLFTIDDVKNIDGDIRFTPYLAEIPETVEQAEAIKQSALLNPFVVRNLLSEDGRTMALNLHLDNEQSEALGDEAMTLAVDAQLDKHSNIASKVFAIGLPYILGGLSEQIAVDQQTILPLSLLALLVVLLITMRRVSAMLMPFLTAGMSIIWTLALLVMLDVPINIMTSIVPALLVIIGSTEDIHLLSAWYRAREQGSSGYDAVDVMGRTTGLAVVLTFVTTYLGFLSIALNDVSLLKEFGLVASMGLFINFLITSLFLPASMSLFVWPVAERNHGSDDAKSRDRYAHWTTALFKMVNKRRTMFILTSSLVFILGLYGSSMIKVDNDNMSFFSEEAAIHQKARFMHDELAGMQSLDIILFSPIEETFLKLRYLEEVKNLQSYLDDTGYFDKTSSFVDYVKLINNVMDEDLEPGELYLPEDDGQVREYMLFIDPEKTRPYINDMFNETRIVIRHNISSSDEISSIIEEIQAYADENLLAGLQVTITGDGMLSRKASDAMVEGQVTSLLFMLAVIVLIIAVLFLDIKAGFVAAIPNIFPVIILFGVMGYADIALNTGTAMIAAIAIGICVDDTMHFLVSYNQQMKYHEDPVDGILAAIEHEARPIISTSIALTAGFGVLAMSDFPPVVHFGALSALVIVLAVISNFILLPILLGYVRLVTIWDVIGVNLRSKLLDKCELFRKMNSFEVRKLIAMSQRITFEKGDTIISKGDVGNEVYVVLAGSVNVRVPYRRASDEGEYRHAASLGVGTVFGEVAFLGSVERTADVIAEEKTELLSLHADGIRRLSRFMPRTASKMYFNLSRILAQRHS